MEILCLNLTVNTREQIMIASVLVLFHFPVVMEMNTKCVVIEMFVHGVEIFSNIFAGDGWAPTLFLLTLKEDFCVDLQDKYLERTTA